MESRDVPPISNILSEVIENLGLSHLVKEKALRDSWKKAVGDKIDAIAKVHKLDGKKLYVKVAHPTWKMELRFESRTIVRKLNEILGETQVEEIIFV